MDTAPTAVLAPPAPERLKMTYEEYLAWVDEDKHAEWVEGEVIVHMPPNIRHQDITTFLTTLLRLFVDFFRLGVVLAAPTEMRLTPTGPSREPDILFVAQAHRARLAAQRLDGPADLVIEIVSDESVNRDRVEKFYEYQGAGVPEYWLFDPRPATQRADVWSLGPDRRYRPLPMDDAGRYHSVILPGFWVRDAWLTQDPLPDPLTAFAEIVGLPDDVLARLRALAQPPREP